jgi:hypothetical protein
MAYPFHGAVEKVELDVHNQPLWPDNLFKQLERVRR